MKRFLFEQQILVKTPIFVDAEDEHEARIKIEGHIGEAGEASYEEIRFVVVREEELAP